LRFEISATDILPLLGDNQLGTFEEVNFVEPNIFNFSFIAASMNGSTVLEAISIYDADL